MPEILKILALTVVLFAAQELLRRSSKWILWGLFGLVPLALTPFWLATNDFSLFLWVKCYTIVACICWGTAVRFTAIGGRQLIRLSIPVLLAGNILEAVAPDLIEGGWAHGLVALTGLILVGMIPMGDRARRIASLQSHRDFQLDLTRGWLIGYTVWNWAFVSLNYPELLGHHTAVLAAALIVGLIDPHRWLQSRACTLGLNLIAVATINTRMIGWLDTTSWFDQRLGNAVAAFAAAFVVGYAAWAWLLIQANPRSTLARSTGGVPPADSHTFAA